MAQKLNPGSPQSLVAQARARADLDIDEPVRSGDVATLKRTRSRPEQAVEDFGAGSAAKPPGYGR